MDAFWSHWIWPLLTAVTGFVFTYLLLKQYLERRKPHQLAWAAGMFLYAASAAIEAYSEFAQSWNPWVYRVYYVMAAVLVLYLGLGTVYLIFKRRIWGHLFLAYALTLTTVFLISSLTSTLKMENLVPGITVGGSAMDTTVRMFSFACTIPGTLALLGGAIYSVILFAAKKEYAYRAWANILIAGGTLVIAGAGSMARSGQTVGLYPAEMIGAALMLWGFMKAGSLKQGALAKAKDKEAPPEPA
jgi:hypothetical protein